MPITEKDALELINYLGVKPDEVKDVAELKNKFDTEFIRTSAITEDSEPVKKILGKTFGTLENEIKKVAKEFEVDVDFDTPELKDKKVKDKLKFFVSEFANKNKSIIDELTIKAGQGNDEKLKEYETKLTKEQQKRKDAENLLNSVKTEYEGFKEQSEKSIKGIKLNILKKDAFSKLKLRPDISEIEKKGFDSVIHEKYNFDIDENESVFVTDKKGAKIPSTKVTGTFKTVTEILEEEAIAGKLALINGDGGKPKPQPITVTPPATPIGAPQRKLAVRIG